MDIQRHTYRVTLIATVYHHPTNHVILTPVSEAARTWLMQRATVRNSASIADGSAEIEADQFPEIWDSVKHVPDGGKMEIELTPHTFFVRIHGEREWYKHVSTEELDSQ